MSVPRSMYDLADKALEYAEQAGGLVRSDNSHVAPEIQALATLSLAYSAMADIAGHCDGFVLPGRSNR